MEQLRSELRSWRVGDGILTPGRGNRRFGEPRRGVYGLAWAGVIALAACPSIAQCPIALSAPSPTNAGPFQWGVAVGDFNEDGRPDLAIARSLTNEVVIQLANGTPGSFAPPLSYAVGPAPVSIAVADVDRDGHPDLLTANLQGGSVSLLKGQGGAGGSFHPAVHFPMGAGATRLGVGDFNADGFPDIATANDGADSVSVRLADGTGGFGGVVHHPVGANPSGLAAADFTGDGLIDLASSNLAGNVSLLRNTGAGVFASPTTYALPHEGVHAVALDANLDGKMDLAVTYSSGVALGVGLLLGNATPTSTFAAPVSYSAGPDAYFAAVGDFNLDGRPDLAVTNFGGGTVAILRGNATATSTFQTPEFLAAPGNPNGAAIADLNADSRPDLVVCKQGGAAFTSVTFLNTGAVPPVITHHPSDATACRSGVAAFALGSDGAASYLWQIESPPGSWLDLSTTPSTLSCGGEATVAPVNSPTPTIAVRGCPGPFRVRGVATNACGSVTSRPATLTLCIADLDDGSTTGTCDGGVTIDDLIYYLTSFAGGDLIADVDDGSGTGTRDGGVTIDDLIYFLTRFQDGC